jgi:hypothetical protein
MRVKYKLQRGFSARCRKKERKKEKNDISLRAFYIKAYTALNIREKKEKY